MTKNLLPSLRSRMCGRSNLVTSKTQITCLPVKQASSYFSEVSEQALVMTRFFYFCHVVYIKCLSVFLK